MGAIGNATGDYAAQSIENAQNGMSLADSINPANIDKLEVGISGGFGAVGGALAPVTGGVTALAANSLLAGVQTATIDIVVDRKDPSEVNPSEVAASMAFGALGAKISGAFPKNIPAEITSNAGTFGEKGILTALGMETGKTAEAYGGRWFAKNANSILVSKQVAALTEAQAVIGAGAGNVMTTACVTALSWCNFSDSDIQDRNEEP